MIWSAAIDLVRALVFAAAHLCGNSLGGGILAVSLVARLALLPITLRAARRMMAHQASVTALAPGNQTPAPTTFRRSHRARACHGRAASAARHSSNAERVPVINAHSTSNRRSALSRAGDRARPAERIPLDEQLGASRRARCRYGRRAGRCRCGSWSVDEQDGNRGEHGHDGLARVAALGERRSLLGCVEQCRRRSVDRVASIDGGRSVTTARYENRV